MVSSLRVTTNCKGFGYIQLADYDQEEQELLPAVGWITGVRGRATSSEGFNKINIVWFSSYRRFFFLSNRVMSMKRYAGNRRPARRNTFTSVHEKPFWRFYVVK
jgi:hypothetical protein